MPSKVYLTGATGRLGPAVLSKIDAVPLVRRSAGLRGEVVTDFSNDQLRNILRDARAVIHLAASIDEPNRRKMHEANVGLTWRIVNAVPKGCRVVFSSSISVYGKNLARKPANEETKTNPDSDYARTKFEAEGVVRKHPLHVILRIGTIYGPQFSEYLMILERIRKGKMKVIGNGKNRIPFVHVDDVASVIVNAVDKGSGTYVVAGEPLTQREIYGIAARELGVGGEMKSVPVPLAMMAAWISEKVRGKGAMKREHVRILSSDRVFDCARARGELGFSPRPLEQGIKEMAAAFRASENVKNIKH